MLASTKKTNGRIGVVIDNGCLFRGGKERAIRASILEDDLIECIILLPEKLFYNTGAPGAIIIFNRNKRKDLSASKTRQAGREGKVLFINASPEYEQHPEVRKLNRLGDQHIAKIAKAYKEFNNIKGFSRAVSPEEIKNNDYNLNVTLYVFPEEEVEEIDIEKEWKDLGKIQNEIAVIEKKIEGYLEKIG